MGGIAVRAMLIDERKQDGSLVSLGERLERRCWELLRPAFVEACYSPHDKITPRELA